MDVNAFMDFAIFFEKALRFQRKCNYVAVILALENQEILEKPKEISLK